MRRRIMEYGPSVRTPRVQRNTVGVIRTPSRTGVIMRNPRSNDLGTTTKSVLRPREWRGIRPPGQRPFNYPSVSGW